MEKLLKAQSSAEEKQRKSHALEDEFNAYHNIGLRSEALKRLKDALAETPSDAKLVRKISDLESKFITRGRWRLCRESGSHQEPGPTAYFLCSNEHMMGRDPLCEIQLGTVGVSRKHAKITIENDAFVLTDQSSKNGVWLNEKRIEGSVSLGQEGHIRLGDHCTIRFHQHVGILCLTPGLEDHAEVHYVLSKNNQPFHSTFDQEEWRFRVVNGTPLLRVEKENISLNGQTVANGEIELIVDDNLKMGQKVYTVSI